MYLSPARPAHFNCPSSQTPTPIPPAQWTAGKRYVSPPWSPNTPETSQLHPTGSFSTIPTNSQVARIPATAHTNSAPQPETAQITALLFDHTQNLIWCGDSAGYSSSFTPSPQDNGSYGVHVPLFRYTKFQALARGAPIIQHLNHQRGVLALLNSAISFHSRRGLTNAWITAPLLDAPSQPLFSNLTCMTLAYSTSSDLIVGGNTSLFKVDLQKPQTVQPFSHRGDLSFINYLAKMLTLGNLSGALEIFDPLANASVKTFAGHNGLLSDLDVKGNYVATCGYSVRTKRFGSAPSALEYMVDPLVNLYDLRMMRALPPLSFAAGASFVKFHPKLPNIVIVASTTGHIQFVDMYDQLQIHLYQADLAGPTATATPAPPNSYLSNLDISKNGEFLCFSDGFRNMRLWSLNAGGSHDFVNFPAPLDRPDVVSNSLSQNPVGIDDDVPLSSVGMPYYKEFLASNYPTDMVFDKELLKVPGKPDAGLAEISTSSPGKIMPYDRAKYGPRNVIKPYQLLEVNVRNTGRKNPAQASLIPKFISERSSTPVSSPYREDSPFLTQTPTFGDHNDIDHESSNGYTSTIDAANKVASVFHYKSDVEGKVPSCYTRLEIHYSKFGVDDFDFDYYNRSNGFFAGLENHLDNSYVNPLLQIYRFIPIFYNTVTKSLLSEYLPNSVETITQQSNPQGSSVLNELAYLFDMMHKAGPKNVSISNFSLILSESKIAQTHNLINKDDGKSLNSRELQQLIITFNKFLVESVVNDYATQFGINVQDMTAMHYELMFSTTSGEFLNKHIGNQATLDLVTPPSNVLNKVNSNNPERYTPPQLLSRKNHTLLAYLEYSLNQSKTLQPTAQTPYPVEVKQSLINLGPVLLINMPFSEQEMGVIKNCKKWLVPEFYTTTGNTGKICFKPVVTQFNQRAEKYELLGYVCEVNRGSASSPGQHNLVSYVKVKLPSLGKDQWMLFNDFLVMPIPEEEVLNISQNWKKPVVLVYHNVEDPRNQKFTYFEENVFRKLSGLNDSILYRDHFACGIREGYKREYELLTHDEAPKFGSLVAIDAEFVSLRPESVEVSYTGVRNLIRPTMLSLARISALRGNVGQGHGVPFIDDYIVHTKPIHDYLTTFSGIEPGDLDPDGSTKTLVTLQTAYRRLWLLLNLGCVFVGHGLKSDFRCINLQVPKAQIRDTIEFYYLPDLRRKLSLKFLAYIVLKEAVQTRNHDSIEDANTALQLYERYLELQASGDFERELRHIYSEGQQLRFRAPDA